MPAAVLATTIVLDIYTQLERDEGKRRVMYLDQLKNPTVGVGHLMTTPLSDLAIRTILHDDVQTARHGIHVALPWIVNLSDAREGALVNLAFNIGIAGLLGFPKMLAAAKDGNWSIAARELLDSKYATQVPERAHRLAEQLLTDKWV